MNPALRDLATGFLSACRDNALLVATAESCTGGLIIATLTEIPGSSPMVDRGFITYSNQAKMEMLGVANATLDEFGAVSEQTAREMAEGALAAAGAGIALSVTGIAGPDGGSETKPVGMVCFGVAISGGATIVQTRHFGDIGRANVRNETVKTALSLGLTALSE
ncbi:CinA family protein [Limoniibacter endophyticus]|uniref:Competence damage-inducible protein A n=1 Tax=Limoniibacter endophyticus TaxID=1565040 RepID=A0A8J3GGY1_9HYPH|nr:CinA family protein [Limoniibacter endophyticus]GHC62962.1 competence damage-inducible protein A [Limoniibacter endophyticus]